MKPILYPLLAAATATAFAAEPAPKPRNVLMILCDDMGAMEPGCYGNITRNLTPNIDALARTGVRFATFFATPVCTPSRVALMTGKYGIHTGHLNMSDQAGGKGHYNLATDEYTFGQMFHDAGYATAMAGKWQLSGRGETLIRDCGFDEYMAWIYKVNLAPGVKYQGGYFPPKTTKTSRYWHPGIMTNGKHIPTTETDYGPDMYSGFIMDFIKRQAAAGKPFFAYYPMALVHSPWCPTPDHPDVKVDSQEAFRANVEYADKIVGRLIDTLVKAGVRDNTLVVFCGDNGTQLRGKLTVTEWGPRTPCIINLPGLVQQGKVSGAMVDIPDITATLLDYAGIHPRNAADLDGISLMPLLTGKTNKTREFAVSYYGQYRIIRDAHWVLEGNKDGAFGDLYYCADLRSGIGYKHITDFTDPAAKAARERFEKFLATHAGATNMTDKDKDWFTNFVTKNGQKLQINLQKIYNGVPPEKGPNPPDDGDRPDDTED